MSNKVKSSTADSHGGLTKVRRDAVRANLSPSAATVSKMHRVTQRALDRFASVLDSAEIDDLPVERQVDLVRRVLDYTMGSPSPVAAIIAETAKHNSENEDLGLTGGYGTLIDAVSSGDTSMPILPELKTARQQKAHEGILNEAQNTDAEIVEMPTAVRPKRTIRV